MSSPAWDQPAKTGRGVCFFKCPVFNRISQYIQRSRENMTHSKEQNRSPETHPKKTQISDLLDKDFETTALNMFN